MSKNDTKNDISLDPATAVAGEPNRKLAGHPGWHKLAFVDPEYYNQFDKRLRPIFQPGGPTTINMSLTELERMQERHEKPFMLETYVNLGLKSHFLTVPGPSGSFVGVEVPPFGILRGDPQQLGRIGMEGHPFFTFYQIAPEGDCAGQQTFKNPVDGRVYQTCKFSKCPRHPDANLAHSIQHGLHFLSSIGQGLADSLDRRVAGYVPDEDAAQQMVFDYAKFDPRPEITVFQAQRLQVLAQRKAARETFARQGARPGQTN